MNSFLLLSTILIVRIYHEWTFGLFEIMMNKTALNILVQVLLWIYVFISLWKILGVKLLDVRVDVRLTYHYTFHQQCLRVPFALYHY